MTYGFSRNFGAGDCAAGARLTCRSVFRQTCLFLQTCLYGGRNRDKLPPNSRSTLDTCMKIKTTSILIGMLFVTAAFLLAQALSPNTGADRSGSPSQPSSRDVGTSATETCDPQTVAKAPKGYTCVVKTKSGSVAWRVEAVIATDSRTFRVPKISRAVFTSATTWESTRMSQQ